MIISSPGATQRDHLNLTIEATLRQWAKSHPEELLAFNEQIAYEREGQGRDRASRPGTQASMSKYGEIPATVYNMISRAVGSPHWHNDPATREAFWSQFQVGKIRRGARLPRHE